MGRARAAGHAEEHTAQSEKRHAELHAASPRIEARLGTGERAKTAPRRGNCAVVAAFRFGF